MEDSRSELENSPHVPRGHRSIGRPFRPTTQHLLRGRQLSQPVGLLDSLLHSEIELTQNIRPSQSEHEEHLRAPSADPFHLRQGRDYLIVGELMQRLHRERPVENMLGQIAYVVCLRRGQSCCPQRFVRSSDDPCRSLGSVTNQSENAAVNCRRSLSRKLLINDRPNERIEVSPLSARHERAASDPVDHAGHNWIRAAKMCDCLAVSARHEVEFVTVCRAGFQPFPRFWNDPSSTVY